MATDGRCPAPQCAARCALPRTRERVGRLVHAHQHLDHRASAQVALLAYAAAGALPHPLSAALPRSRPSPARGRVSARASPFVAEPWLGCAICRIAHHELSLAASLLSECGASSEMADLLNTSAVSTGAVLCEHMEALGMLGHTRRRVTLTRPICDALMREQPPFHHESACKTQCAEVPSPPALASCPRLLPSHPFLNPRSPAPPIPS